MAEAPERIVCGGLVLRPWSEDDAAAVAESIEASRDHLRPWMPWLEETPETLDAVKERHLRWRNDFDRCADLIYGIFSPGGGVLGSAGSHLRNSEPGVREIGYWTDVRHLRRGIATTTAAALTRVAFELLEAPAVEIHCDPANTRSQAVPYSLGFLHVGTIPHPAQAPAETGSHQVWRIQRADHPASPAASLAVEAYNAAGVRVL